MQKVYLDNLPRNKKSIDWKNSIGEKVCFVYNEINDYIVITDYNNAMLTIKYKNFHSYNININGFVKCRLGVYLNNIVICSPWMIPYFQGGYDEAKLYSANSSKRIYPVCPDCGRVKSKSNSINSIYVGHSIGCSCSDSVKFPNKLMFNILEQLKIMINA